jgi:hypothetical protein
VALPVAPSWQQAGDGFNGDGVPSVTVVDYDSAPKGLGVSFRRQRPGPESDLVGWFLHEWPIVLPSRYRATVFREPRIESGFPDLVVVIWDVAVAKRWRPSRVEVRTPDLRIMHYLANHGPQTEEHLRNIFSAPVSSGLERLSEASMVHHCRGRWRARALSTCFAARQIIAIEAKVNEWASALLQAALNTWFASGSYVLLPRDPRKAGAASEAQALGVRIWTKGTASLDGRSGRAEDLPRSYASWLFNELAWRAALPQGTRRGQLNDDRGLAAGQPS